VAVVEFVIETEVLREHHRPSASHWQILLRKVVSSAPSHGMQSNG